MYAFADQLDAGAVVQDFDICIVGAGAAGIAMAQRLANTSVTVLLLVSGGPADRGLPDEARQALYQGTAGDFLQRVDPDFLRALALEYVRRHDQSLRLLGAPA